MSSIAPGRRALPNRRPAVTMGVPWCDHRFAVTVGIDPCTGRVSEVFYSGGLKSGADLRHTIEDNCVLISVALQYGLPLSALSKSLGTLPDAAGQGARPASPLGAILGAVAAADAAFADHRNAQTFLNERGSQ